MRMRETMGHVDGFYPLQCQKLYRLAAVTSPDPATQALRDELQASRLPFHACQRRPLTPEDIPETGLVRCRPIRPNSRPTTAQGVRPYPSLTPADVYPKRPSSTPVHGMRTPHTATATHHLTGLSLHPASSHRTDTPRVEPGKFDTLSPRILSKMVQDVQPRPWSASYGDRIHVSRPHRRRGQEAKVNNISNIINDDISTTSGIDTDLGDDIDDDVDDDDDSTSDEDDDNSSDSEDGGFEPSLEDVKRQMPHPQSIFRMRPEKLDAIYVPENKRDMRRFDFEAEKVEQPAYQFKWPLPDLLKNISLRLCAQEGTDWRDYITTTPTLGAGLKSMMERLVELERYQILTEQWEAKRLKGATRRQEKMVVGNPESRVASARSRDKRCCGLCLQAACVGDCPEKRQVRPGRCHKCHQPLCTGACQDSRYEQRMRKARSNDSLIFDEPPPQPPPRSPSRGCYSCLKRHNAKLINANNLLLGRPKSSNATYSWGTLSRRPRDLRPASASTMHSALLKGFHNLGIEPQQPAPPSKPSSARNGGRKGLLPGKSSRSNRKNSISVQSSKTRQKKTKRRSEKTS